MLYIIVHARYRIFRILLYVLGNIHISYCNQSTAWVTLLEQEKSKLVISGLIEPNLKETPGLRKPYTVLTWNSFHEKITAAKHNISSSLHLSNRQSLRLSKMNTTSTPKTVNDVIPTTEDCSSGEGKGKDDCIKLYSKRSGDINNTPRKRKKDDQDEDLTYVSLSLCLKNCLKSIIYILSWN